MPHSARWRHFLGKGRSGEIPGVEILKKRLSSEQWLERYKEAIWHNKNTSTTSTAVLAWLSHFIQRLRLYPVTRIPIHSLIISCLDYCNTVCAKLLFFFLIHTLQDYSELPCLLCFSLKYPCCSHTFSLTVILLYVFRYIWNQDWNFNVSLQSFKNLKNSRLQLSKYSPVHLLILYHSCYPNTPSFFCMLKIYAFHMFLCLKNFKYFILLLMSVPRDQLNWQLFAALQHILSHLKQCTGCCNSRGFPQMSQCSHWKKMQQKAQYI